MNALPVPVSGLRVNCARCGGFRGATVERTDVGEVGILLVRCEGCSRTTDPLKRARVDSTAAEVRMGCDVGPWAVAALHAGMLDDELTKYPHFGHAAWVDVLVKGRDKPEQWSHDRYVSVRGCCPRDCENVHETENGREWCLRRESKD